MYILSQSKEQLVNIKNIIGIEIRDNFYIVARCITNGVYTLAEYKNRKRAEEIFEEIVKQLGDTEKYLATTDMLLTNEGLIKEKERLEELYKTDIILSDMRYNITPIKNSEKIYRMPEE